MPSLAPIGGLGGALPSIKAPQKKQELKHSIRQSPIRSITIYTINLSLSTL